MTGGSELWPDGPVALPARIRLGDDTYRVRAMPDRVVLHTLADGAWTRLVPSGLRRRDAYRVAVRLYDPGDALDLPHLWRAATALGGRLAGIDVDEGHEPQAAWWPAHRIAAYVIRNWLLFDGWCVRRGFDPHTAPVYRVIAAGWQFVIDTRPAEGSGKDEKQVSVESLRTKFWTPPGEHRKQIMRFTASQERESALAALREALPG